MTTPTDDLILGSGEGGKYLAWHLARSGRKAVVVERRWIGGSCPNINCLPSKNLIHSARVAATVRRAAEYGVHTGPVSTDHAAVRDRKRSMVDGLIQMHLDNYQKSGAELVMGTGRFTAPRELTVALNDGGEQRYTAERFFLNVGTTAAIPNLPGLSDANPLTNIEALELDHTPEHLIVLGGGYVGLELAQMFRRLGSRVTVVESGARVAGREDSEVSAMIHDILTGEGIEILTSASAIGATGISGQQVTLNVNHGGSEHSIVGSHLLVAAGRRPSTAGIGLDIAGVELDQRGYIKVNPRLETTASNVWAIGECNGGPQFTHVSLDDFRIIRDNLAGGNRSTTDRLVPYCMFTDPPLARVGLSEREAVEAGSSVRVAAMPASAILRTRTTGERDGMLKALVGDDDRIVGFTMIGADAGDVMAAVQVAMMAGMSYQQLRDAILAHPTTAEGLNALLGRIT